jgi:hypothetical protein
MRDLQLKQMRSQQRAVRRISLLFLSLKRFVAVTAHLGGWLVGG